MMWQKCIPPVRICMHLIAADMEAIVNKINGNQDETAEDFIALLAQVSIAVD